MTPEAPAVSSAVTSVVLLQRMIVTDRRQTDLGLSNTRTFGDQTKPPPRRNPLGHNPLICCRTWVGYRVRTKPIYIIHKPGSRHCHPAIGTLYYTSASVCKYLSCKISFNVFSYVFITRHSLVRAKGEVFGLLYVCLFVCSVNDFSTTRGPIHAIFCMRA